MRKGIGYLLVYATGFLVLSWTYAQERAPSQPAQAPQLLKVSSAGLKEVAPVKPSRDLSKLGPLQQQMYLGAQRGADWLFRVNLPDGRFVNGYVTALKTPLEGDHYYRQVEAATALARAARLMGEERMAARARQAVLTVLADTGVDDGARSTTLPPPLVNRLAAAGMLLQAIGELPAPAQDLLDQAEQLCAFIHGRQLADGSFRYSETPESSLASPDVDGTNHFPGQALYGLMLSQRLRPAPWKLEAVRKALAFYLPWWRTHKNPAFVPWHAAAYAEAFLLSGEQPYADAVNEMTDWLCELQYPLLDPRRPFWGGGFMSWVDGKPAMTAPGVSAAVFAESLAAATRVARKAGDLPRYQRYREALERSLQFLAGLQFTDANTQHFADWYRPYLAGAFHAAHDDGNIRLDYTAHAVSALVQYLAYVAE